LLKEKSRVEDLSLRGFSQELIRSSQSGGTMRSLKTLFIATLATTLLVGAGVSGPASAVEPEGAADTGEVALMVKVNGVAVPLEDAFLEAAALDLHATTPTDPHTVSPSLINFDQWFRCYSLNEENTVFELYTHYWDGVGKDIRLKCGTSGWGYKHIRERHEGDWQVKMDTARSRGWNAILSQGSWDDLMNASVASTVIWGEFVGGDALNNTKCSNSTMSFVNTGTGQVVYEFNVTAVWANDSDRLITAYPTSKFVC
jgi:hypothetical protein